jgi:branched-chain amino acid transport system substrate-binding protein
MTMPATLWAADGTIKLGISGSESGSFSSPGEMLRNAVKLVKQEVDASGGIKIGGKSYTLDPIIVNNASSRTSGTTNALALIGKDKVMAIVGPLSSDRAIAVGEIANAFKTPMVTPLSTSPLTTLNRPYVFRMPMMFDIQSKATTEFAAKEWKATKVAILYDEVSPYPTGLAKAFKAYFEKINGPGSVVAVETFRTGDFDFSKQLERIMKTDAEFIYTPQHDTEVPMIIRQAKSIGWTKPITGGNGWAAGDLLGQCGSDCKGMYFTGHFAPDGATGQAKVFVDKYKQAFGKTPGETAALSYDAMHLIVQALEKMNQITGNVVTDRENLKTQIAATTNFQGITGKVAFHGTGDPERCAVMVKITDQNELVNYTTICP